jgi:hypothetical protein
MMEAERLIVLVVLEWGKVVEVVLDSFVGDEATFDSTEVVLLTRLQVFDVWANALL